MQASNLGMGKIAEGTVKLAVANAKYLDEALKEELIKKTDADNAALIYPLSAVAEPSNYEEKQTYLLLFHLIKHLHEVYTKNSPNLDSINSTKEIQFAEALVLTLKFGIDHELYSNGKQTAPLPLKERLSLVKARIASNAVEFPGPWEILTAKHIQKDDRAELPLKMGGTVCGSKL